MKTRIKEALITMHNMSELIIKHAVEEEARLMRVIMQKAKDESADSIKLCRNITGLLILKHKLQNND